MLKEKLQKAKEHVKEHKEVYISSAILAGITVLIMRGGKAHINGHTDSGKAHINGHTIYSFGNGNTNIISVKERNGRGHPGYLIQDKQSKIVYESQKVVCDALDINYKHMSDHLNGRRPDINGQHFERVIAA